MKAKCTCFLFSSVIALRVFCHEIPVHRNITEHAAASAWTYSGDYVDFLNSVASDIAREEAEIFMEEGSAREDDRDAPGDLGKKRSLAHFYDPLTGRGLSDLPVPNDGQPFGLDSFTWGTVFNGSGVSKSYNLNPVNEWSWQNARDYQWQGLTEADPDDRHEALTNMFRALGQVIHLLQDASQPHSQ